jgi:predicted lipid-binding transport protein (Tim44 family)
VFALYVWLGGLAVGVHGGTAFIFGAVIGFLVFLLVMAYGADAPVRQPRRADRR